MPPVIDTGRGPVVVLIPGIQGRWEWMAPTVAALAARHRVISFSLTGPGVREPSFEAWASTIDTLLDRAGVAAATVVGVSFGGLVAMYYAAHRPARVRALVLASTPSPHWRPDPRTARYMRHPQLVMPVLVARSIVRLTPEILAARPSWGPRLGLAAAYAWRALRSPISPRGMVRCVAAWRATDLAALCRCITAPTTIITGDRTLDRVVPVAGTMEIAPLIPHARLVPFTGTGHIGSITRPERFVALVDDANAAADEADAARGRKRRADRGCDED